MRKINQIVVHCSATRCDRPYTESWLNRRSSATWLQWGRNHYYVCLNGDIKSLRPVMKPGAHVKGCAASIGICYEGGMDKRMPVLW